MAHIRDDTDTSVGRDPVFDWGFSRDESSVGKTDESAGNDVASLEPSSRYDPKAMSRIVDITDLVDESDDADSDDEDDMVRHGRRSARSKSVRGSTSGGKKAKRNKKQPLYKSPLLCRQALILLGLVGIIAAASVAIGYAVIGMNKDASNEGGEQQRLLIIAERVTTACSESNLDGDMSDCQDLCDRKLCCFELSGSQYSCEDDETMNCPVYAGCQALVEGAVLDEEDRTPEVPGADHGADHKAEYGAGAEYGADHGAKHVRGPKRIL